MINIQVISEKGAPLGQPIMAVFGPEGGTIGRSDTNTLVLNDADRTVSRTHARVVCRAGNFLVIDQGSNPLQLNGQAIGSGNEAALNVGDRLVIGNFELEVSQPPAQALPAEPPLAAVADDDPFAHLLDGLVAPPPAQPTPTPAAAPVDPTAGLFPDPLVGSSAAEREGQFSGMFPGAASADPPVRPGGFEDLISPSKHQGSESIDAVFGLSAPLANDPLAMSPLDDPLIQPNMAAAQDPLAALSRQPVLRPDARSDHLPVDAFGFVPPVASIPGAPPLPEPPRVAVKADAANVQRPLPERTAGVQAPDPFAGLDDLVAPSSTGEQTNAVAANQPGHGLQPLGVPGAQPPPRAAAPGPAVITPVPAPMQVRAADTPTASAARAAASSVGSDDLLAAFVRGLGPLQQPVELLTPGLMQRVGELLRSSTEGTLQLLIARQEIKREVRAEVTVIAAQANNPLKFSPTVEVALSHLLGPGMRGFMPAEAAMRDAYQDLRAHEFGVMVGMRAALEHVVRQFEPDRLEKNIAAKSRLDAIFSANRKAKLWDQFVKLYGDIAREAEDDFHALFGKAFLKAYQEQLDRLKAGDHP